MELEFLNILSINVKSHFTIVPPSCIKAFSIIKLVAYSSDPHNTIAIINSPTGCSLNGVKHSVIKTAPQPYIGQYGYY